MFFKKNCDSVKIYRAGASAMHLVKIDEKVMTKTFERFREIVEL